MSIINALCDIGSADIVFIDDLIEDWGINSESLTRSVWDDVEVTDLCFDANDIIRKIFDWIADEYKLAPLTWSCFINCLDSHFYYKGEEVHSKEDLETLLENEE